MIDFSARPVKIYDLPLTDTADISQPEQVVLLFSGSGSIDIGALCYQNRGNNRRRKSDDCCHVDLSSFSSDRAKIVEVLILKISDIYKNSGLRSSTLHMRVNIFVTMFMMWSDRNHYSDVLTTENQSLAALRSYVYYLRNLTLQNMISVNTAAKYLENILYVLCAFHENDDLNRGLFLIRRSDKAIEQTNSPCEDAQSKVLALSESLFLGFYRLVNEGKPFPYRLNLPSYLGWSSNYLWIFPHRKWCFPPHQFEVRHKFDKPYWACDYANGRLATFDEIWHKYTSKRLAFKSIEATKLRIMKANGDDRDPVRLQIAMVAHNVFVMLFIANTGMNLAQVVDLQWDSNYKSCVERQGFRTIKWRASGRHCQFEINSTFLSKFKKYLQLRNYILSGEDCNYLFFTCGVNNVEPPKQMTGAIIDSIYKTLRNIDPNLQKVTTREWRVAKAEWLIRTTDPAVTASVLQNSEKTVRKHYASGSDSHHKEEMSNYFAKVEKYVVGREQSTDQDVEMAIGSCTSFGSPHDIEVNIPIKPDCREPQGCLFCSKYRVHADELDTRKLLSCRFFLKKVSQRSSSNEQFQMLFSPIFERIEKFLNVIAQINAGMVARITDEVEKDGELYSYWASKLNMLIELEIVI